MSDWVDKVLLKFASQDSTIIDEILKKLEFDSSTIVEIIGECGTGKSYIFQELHETLNQHKIEHDIYIPFIFKYNQFKELITLLTDIKEEHFNELIDQANELGISSKYDFFFFLCTKIDEQKLFKPKIILINDGISLDQYTLDFLRYLVQYFEKQNIKFVIFSQDEISPYSEKIEVHLASTKDIKEIVSEYVKDDKSEYITESEIISKISDGNLHIVAHLLMHFFQKGKKIDFSSYIGKKISIESIYSQKISELNESQRTLLITIFLLIDRVDKKNLENLNSKTLFSDINILKNERLIFEKGKKIYPNCIFVFKDYFLSLPKTKQNHYYNIVVKNFDNKLTEDLRVIFKKHDNKTINTAIDYLSKISDYKSLKDIYNIMLEKLDEPSGRIDILKKLGLANVQINNLDTATENFREALKLCVENSMPAEEIVYHLSENLFNINSLVFALELIKKYSPSSIDNYWKWKLTILKAQILMDMEKFDEALEIVDKAYQISTTIDERKKRHSMQANSRKLKGLIFYYAYELDKAEREFDEAEKLYKSFDNIKGLAAIYNNLGGLSIAHGDWDKTEKLYLKSLEYEKMQYSLSGISGCYSNLGSLFEDESDYKKSLYYLNEALKIQKLLDDRDVITKIYNNIGVTYMDNGKFKEAEDSFNKLLELGLKFHLYRNVIAALNNLGALYFKSGDWAKATDFYERAIKKSKDNNFYEGLCKSYNNLGELYEIRKEYSLAYECYNKSKELLPKISEDFLKAELYGNLGSILTCLHRFKEAYGYLVESYDFFKGLNAKDKMIEGAQKQAYYFIQTRNYESANYYLNVALKISEEINNEFQIGRCYHLQALLEKENSDLAEELLKKSINMFVKTNNNFDLAMSNYEYASLLFKKDEWEQALQILRSNRKIIKRFDAIKFLEKNDILIQKISQKHAKELDEAKQQESLLDQFYEVTQDLNNIGDFDVLLETSLEKLIEFSEADGGIFCLYKNQLVKDTWEYIIFNNISNEDKDFSKIMDIVDKTFDENKGQNIKQPHFAPDYNNIISFPLGVRNDKKGVICIFSKHGSHYFTEKMFNLISALCNQIIVIVENISFSILQKSHAVIREELAATSTFANIIGKSENIRAIFNVIEKVKDTPTTILLEGPSGTGKELIARAIHYNSNRRNKKFVAQYCGALPETLLESELFGHVKGAFTGATHDKKGLFEVADGGTFFLDEIADISLSTQAKLLRFLQEGEIKRVGSTRTERVNVRVICATNVSLKERVEKSEFRLDLYYRLNVIRIEVPSLRERKSDIPLLTVHFLDKYCQKIDKKVNGITDEAMKYLMNYDWPGNIRQLENEIERAVTLAEKESYIKSSDLSKEIYRFQENIETINLLEKKSLKDAVEKLERQMIIKTLDENNWNQTRTAKELGLSRQGLIKKMQRYKLMK